MGGNMVTIYLTRHGETQWNLENRLQGSKDSELTEKGINNAMRLGERLKDIPFNAIYSSPSGRAFMTAEYIKSTKDVPIFTDENLTEIHLGDWEGKTKEEISAIESSRIEFLNFWNNPLSYNHKPHNGEDLSKFKQRVVTVLERIISSNKEGNILIVTHAVVIKAILAFTRNIPTERMWDPPFIHGTSLTIFDWDGEEFTFKEIGDTSHFLDETV